MVTPQLHLWDSDTRGFGRGNATILVRTSKHLSGCFVLWSHRNVTHSARNRNRVYNKVTKLLQHFQLSENFF